MVQVRVEGPGWLWGAGPSHRELGQQRTKKEGKRSSIGKGSWTEVRRSDVEPAVILHMWGKKNITQWNI